MYPISFSTTFSGNLSSGIPYVNHPPNLGASSNTVTLYPLFASSVAAERPLGPEPIIATFSFVASGISKTSSPKVFS